MKNNSIQKIMSVTTIVLFVITNLYAQAPVKKMNYEAVIHNNKDELVRNAPVGIQVTILKESQNGPVIYSETHTTVSNSNGLVSVDIGAGKKSWWRPDFNDIDWSSGAYFIRTEIDPTGGTEYTLNETSQLLSVPYAMHVNTAENYSGTLTEEDPVFEASVAGGISEADFHYWNNKQEKLSAGKGITLKDNRIDFNAGDFKESSQNSTVPGKVSTPWPTIHNLAVEWSIQGDDNLNGVVTVEFRKKESGEWKTGMPLRRVPAGENIGFQWENKHSGSIFDLEQDTEYEIRLKLYDPDGGNAEKIVTAKTRPEPVITDKAAIVEIKPGIYDTLYTESGTPDSPRVYRCSEGTATFSHIDVRNKKWVYIEGLNVVNLKERGRGIHLNGAENCVVRKCTINAVYGIVAYRPGATNCYFSDNVITGICEWNNEAMGAHGANIGEGIEITGPGNVICYNKVTGFRDCISTMEDSHVVNQMCIDIYNNDIYSGVDDAIEADFCFSNCRIMRNRITNSYVGLSSQPGLGGPNYFIRNVMYNVVHAAFKLKRASRGDVVLHNTVVKVGAGLGGNSAMDHAYFRNNLAIGGPDGGINWGDYGAGTPSAAQIIDPGPNSDFDYDAVGVYEIDYRATIGGKPFGEVEKNGIERIKIEEVFYNVEFPFPPVPEREVPDLRPKTGSRVVDAAVIIPNINDNYNGRGPDIGAYEAGEELPHYGPRY